MRIAVSPRIYLTGALATILAIVFVAVAEAVVPYALPNVLGTATQNSQGTSASIQTSNPTIRPSNSGWVYHRVIARLPGSNSWVEVGWDKDAALGNCPRVYYTIRDINGTTTSTFYTGCGTLGMGVNYNYQVTRTSSNTWNIYWNSLSTPIRTIWVGWDTASEWASGGEAQDNDEGMGDSTHNNVSWRSTSGSWFCACGYGIYNSNPRAWTLTAGGNSSSWRIYGNN